MAIQRVQSKWAKTTALLCSEQMRQYIPETSPFRRETIRAMLDQHQMVYVKPDLGTFGHGVIRVDKLQHHSWSYQFQLGKRIRRFSTFDSMYKQLAAVQSGKRYLIQKGIHLLKHQNRRFDLRVMVQHNMQGMWETTGIIGRLGHPAKIVTNYHSGGTPLSFQTLMSSHLPEFEQTNLLNRLSVLGVNTAQQLQTHYPGLKEIGIDIALGTDMHPWILEVNTLPDPFLFRKLKDRMVFKRIYRYAVGYGRFKK
ncbi:conserved hypothetical protein [Paenibacillus curdlanolyticus YK9]|uniref:ATP-grasp domain-containing protein n=1 Tax=Paenibacillus curdlanolyticus YK9 TaxID=717606 RepID=E0I978_9BACL|nr:YheC/YheD family protein [Paenibacillus curdlanolyticus]EFM10962.1 conserved hypothetical protein [Paenibacillus curdlanolyticus YK9]